MNIVLQDFKGEALADGEFYRIYPQIVFQADEDGHYSYPLVPRHSSDISEEELDDGQNYFAAIFLKGKLIAISTKPPYKPIANITPSYIDYSECIYPYSYFDDEGDNLSMLDPADPIMPDDTYAKELDEEWSQDRAFDEVVKAISGASSVGNIFTVG